MAVRTASRLEVTLSEVDCELQRIVNSPNNNETDLYNIMTHRMIISPFPIVIKATANGVLVLDTLNI